jgi:hypothetical protein
MVEPLRISRETDARQRVAAQVSLTTIDTSRLVLEAPFHQTRGYRNEVDSIGMTGMNWR